MSKPLAIVTLLLTAAFQTPEPSIIARTASEEFAQARFTPLIARFNAPMKAAATEAVLQNALTQLTGKVGAFERADASTECKEVAAMRVCLTPLLFERARVTLQIAVDADGLIAGLVIAGVAPRDGTVAPPAASARPPAVSGDVLARQE
jgi:hypothetical protein